MRAAEPVRLPAVAAALASPALAGGLSVNGFAAGARCAPSATVDPAASFENASSGDAPISSADPSGSCTRDDFLFFGLTLNWKIRQAARPGDGARGGARTSRRRPLQAAPRARIR